MATVKMKVGEIRAAIKLKKAEIKDAKKAGKAFARFEQQLEKLEAQLPVKEAVAA